MGSNADNGSGKQSPTRGSGIFSLIVVCVWISLLIQSCIWCSYSRWVMYDNSACGGVWEQGECKVLSSSITERVQTSRGGRGRTSTLVFYNVRHAVELLTSSGDTYTSRAWLAPAWTQGPNRLGGDRWRRMITDEARARHYSDRFPIGSSHSCYYNLSEPTEVSMLCRDKAMKTSYNRGVVLLLLVLSPLYVPISMGLLAGICERCTGIVRKWQGNYKVVSTGEQ